MRSAGNSGRLPHVKFRKSPNTLTVSLVGSARSSVMRLNLSAGHVLEQPVFAH